MAIRRSCCVREYYPDYDPDALAAPAADEAPANSGGPRLSTHSQLEGTTAVIPIGTAPVIIPNGFFDAHLHLLDFFQETEGIAKVLEAMDACGVSHAAIMGCPLKKNWSEFETRMSDDVYCDTDILYYFSVTDLYLLNQLKTLPPDQAGRFRPLMSGFKPTDRSATKQIESVISGHPEIVWRGMGKLYLRYSEITNLTTGPVASPLHPAFQMLMADAAQRNMPVIIQHNACSESTKPYKSGFEYIPELAECLQKYPEVKVLWVDAGVYVRGQWGGYAKALEVLMTENPNLYISVTPECLRCKKLSYQELVQICENHPENVMVGSSTQGTFVKKSAYKKDWELIKKFAGALSKDTYKKVTFTNGFAFYRQRSRRASKFTGENAGENKLMHQGTNSVIRTKSDRLHNDEEAKKKDALPPPEKNRMLSGMKDGVLTEEKGEIQHVTIDVHLHMLDFLQKSAGTRKILEAMDGCGVEKAVLIGMPCCKKWSKDEPEQPLYYQDDNGQCYVYSYADQMIADAWLALDDNKRKRFAPVMASINPTDINAVSHIERMWEKYPGMWRGLGELMCRHDDLTTLLQEDETPAANHMAMRPLYEFCIEKNINCMVHQNADRTAEAEDDGQFEYLWEIEQVLDAFPDLKFVWCHAGVSRRTFEPTHHEMLDRLCNQYPQLHIDMSWVVWEECVLDSETAKPRKCWGELFEKHPTRFSIGSDQVGQFISPTGGNLLKPEIVKYWTLADVCSAKTTRMILHDNAEQVWFEGWDVPTSDKGGRWRRIPPAMKAETLFHNAGYFDWQNDEMY